MALPVVCQLAFGEGWWVFCSEDVHKCPPKLISPQSRLSSWLRGVAEGEGVGAHFCSPQHDA